MKPKTKLILSWLFVFAAVIVVVYAVIKSTSYTAQPKPTVTVAELQKRLVKKAPAQTSSTPTKSATKLSTSPTPSTTQQSVTVPQPPEQATTVTQTSPALTNTGPGNVIELFIIVTICSVLFYNRWIQVRRDRFTK